MHNENWDDLRFVLAVAEAGSVSAAARTLGVNHATVLRRIASFEDRHGIEIFEKGPRGYVIPADRLRVIDAAREVETAMQSVERLIRGRTLPLSGVVRVTSTDSFCLALLPDVVAEMQARARGLKIELLSTNAHLDLHRLHADITVRPAEKLPEDLAGDKVALCGFAPYVRSTTQTGAWLGLTGPLSRTVVANWMNDHLPDAQITGAADSFVTLREMVAAGMGQAVLPCMLGDADPRLRRVTGLPELAPIPIWVASHVDLADAPRLRTVRRQLGAALAARNAMTSGRPD